MTSGALRPASHADAPVVQPSAPSVMTISIHQPAYLPWLGYLDRIAASDAFVFLDTVQFEKNSFTNRNRIKTPQGALWLTVPVLADRHFDRTLADLEIDNRQDWKRKHLRSIEQSYRRSPCFAERVERLVSAYSCDFHYLVELCFDQLRFWLEEFGVRTPVIRASELAVAGSKSDLVLALCKSLRGTRYLSGPLGRDYLDERRFAEAGITLCYHEFAHPIYPQLYGEFVPALSALDYWMNSPSLDLFAKRP